MIYENTRRLYALLVSSVALSVMVVGCDSSGVAPPSSTTADSEDENGTTNKSMVEDAKQYLDQDIVSKKDLSPTANKYTLKEGKKVLHLRSIEASEGNTQGKTNGSVETEGYRYHTYKYDGDNFLSGPWSRNIGYFEEYKSDQSDETFRSSHHFNGLSEIPNYSDVYKAKVGVYLRVAYDDTLSEYSRDGVFNIVGFRGNDTSPNEGDEEHYTSISGKMYASKSKSIPGTLGYIAEDNTSDYSSDDNLIVDLEDKVSQGKDVFAVGVKADNESSSGALAGVGDESDLYIYYTEKPTKPSLESPSDGETAEGDGGSITVKWGASDGDPSPTYTVQWSTSSNLDNNPNETTTSSTQVEISGLTDGEQYYWRVKAENFEGTATSSKRSFEYLEGLKEPQLTAKKESGHPKLDWTSVDKAEGYVVHRINPSQNLHETVDVSSSTTEYVDNTVYSEDLTILNRPQYADDEVHYFVEAESQSRTNTESSKVYYKLGDCTRCAY